MNALNVQLRPQGIQSVISNVDLGRDNYIDISNQTFIAMDIPSISELHPQNPVTNTILHSLLVPPAPTGVRTCTYTTLRDGINMLSGTADQVDRPFLNLGLPQREWQSRILQEALPTDTLRLIVNPTNTSINKAVHTSDLPMNASRAAILFD